MHMLTENNGTPAYTYCNLVPLLINAYRNASYTFYDNLMFCYNFFIGVRGKKITYLGACDK